MGGGGTGPRPMANSRNLGLPLVSIVEYLKAGVRERRLVGRNWYHILSVDETQLIVRFTFMCPCGNDINEEVTLPSPYSVDWDDLIPKHALNVLLIDLESHLKGD